MRWILCGVAFVCFVAFTLVVKFGNVAPVNEAVWQHLGTNTVWQMVTDWLGYVTILLALWFVGLFCWQVLRRKSLFHADRNLWALIVVLVGLVVVYGFFELVVVNYRPLLVDGVAKASYPSTHAMLFATVLPLVVGQVWHYLRSKPWCIICTVLLVVVLLVGVLGRLLCGVHWLTDIVAGLLVSLFLNGLYWALNAKTKEEQ